MKSKKVINTMTVRESLDLAQNIPKKVSKSPKKRIKVAKNKSKSPSKNKKKTKDKERCDVNPELDEQIKYILAKS